MHMRITRLEFAVSRLHQCASDLSENTKNMDKYNEQLDVEIELLTGGKLTSVHIFLIPISLRNWIPFCLLVEFKYYESEP